MESLKTIYFTILLGVALVIILAYWYAAIAIAGITLLYLAVCTIRKAGKLWNG